MLLQDIVEELVGFVGVELVARGEGDIELFFQGLDHVHALEGRGEVDFHGGSFRALRVVFDLVSAKQAVYHTRDQFFRHFHQVVHISIGHVEFTSGEFRVVGQVDTFVTELTPDFVHTVQSTDGQHLEEEFGGNTHEHVELEIVMVSDEGLGGGTTGDLVHHGGFHFQKALLVQVRAEVADDLGASDELVTDIGVHDQIQVTLTVSLFLILEAIVGLGQHAQTGGQQLDLLGEDGQFTTLRLTRAPTDTNNITTTQKIMDSSKVVSSTFAVSSRRHDLDLHTFTVQIVESELGTRRTLVVDTTSHSDHFFRDLAGFQLAVLFNEGRESHVHLELVRVRVGRLVFAQLTNGLAT